jgi:molybdopterin synthase sulfur carrier subunit
MMTVTIHIPGSLSHWLNGRDEAICSGNTIRDCFIHMNAQHPGFLSRIINEAGNIENVLVFLNGENIRNLDGLETNVNDGDEIGIIPLAAGG